MENNNQQQDTPTNNNRNLEKVLQFDMFVWTERKSQKVKTKLTQKGIKVQRNNQQRDKQWIAISIKIIIK